MMNALANLSIGRKLTAAFAVVIVASAASGGVTRLKLGEIDDAVHWNEHTYRVLDRAGRLVATMVDQETGVRGHLLNGDPKFLEPYHAGREAFRTAYDEIRRLTADNATQQARLEQIGNHARAWTEGHAGRQIALMARDDEASRSEARRMEEQGAGKAAMDALRAKVAEVADAERRLLVERTAAQQRAFSMAEWALLLGSAASVLLAVVAGFALVRGVTRPLTALDGALGRLRDADLALEVPETGRGDELGTMARSVAALRESLRASERMRAEREAEQAARQARGERVEALVRSFEAEAADALRAVAAASTELDATATEMQRMAQNGSERAHALSAASGQASTNVNAVAASTEQMAASVSGVARQVVESARVARQAAEDARATDTTVSGMAEAAGRIGEVVRLIGDIAGQTNLLALNATIEAARAGEAGKGFAVVASEVKALAAQTAKATEEISAQITAMQTETTRAVDAIRTIAKTIEDMDGLTAQVAAAAEEQSAATREIGRAVAEAATGTQEVDRHVTGVTEGAQQAGSAATQLRGASGELARQAEGLRTKVDSFLSGIRAA